MIFKDKNIVITGGTGGIGLEICRQFLMQGIKSLAILDIIIDRDNTINDFKQQYPNANIICLKTDVTKKDEVKQTFTKIIEEFQYIDIFIGAAGIFNDQTIENTLNVNILGVINTTLVAMELMSKLNNEKGDKIIATIGSIASFSPSLCFPVYTASKHAVLGFIRSLAEEFYYEKHGIKFITICPGPVNTPITHDLENKTLFLDNAHLIIDRLKIGPISLPADMGKLIIEIISKGENGSVWIAHNNEITQITLTEYWNY